MNLSLRLNAIADFIPKCNFLADIGTDHAYIPIRAVLNNTCNFCIASDIKIGPIKIAERNIKSYGLEDKIETRVGSGLSVLKKGEADIILISGMGGNLISQIIDEEIEIAKAADYLILQPVQYPEELRKFLEDRGFEIKDEELAKDDDKYYHIIKASEGSPEKYEKEAYYYTGQRLMEKRHPLLISYCRSKIERINEILNQLDSSAQTERKNELLILKEEFEEVIKCQ